MSDRTPREETTEFKDFINQMKSNYLKRADFTGTKSTVLGMNERSFDNQDKNKILKCPLGIKAIGLLTSSKHQPSYMKVHALRCSQGLLDHEIKHWTGAIFTI